MPDYVRVLTAEQAAEEDDRRAGCLAGIVCCVTAVYYYNLMIGPLGSPAKKIGALGCGLLALILGNALRGLVWATIFLGIAVFIGWKVVQWIMA